MLIFTLLMTMATGATNIRCTNAEYAGKTLVFYMPSDPVSDNTTEWFTLNFDADGNASTEVNVSQTTYGFSDFGIYRGMLFVQANKNISLKLPPLREKSFADQKNPYFSPVSFWFITESGKDLNDQISAFEQQMNYLTDKNFNKLYVSQSQTVFDSVKTSLEQLVPADASATLKMHEKMKLAMLETDIFRKRPESYSGIFNDVSSSFWLHPTFMEFFNKTFDKQLSFSAQAIKGEDVKKAVETRNLSELISFTESKYHISGKTTDLALLKMLHDAYYSNEFSKKAVLDLLHNNRFANNSNELIRKTDQNIVDKLVFMQVGSEAPVICLQDLNGKKECTNALKDKFKYLVFADVETMVCREQLKYLSRINELFNKNLEIYVILRDTDPDSMKAFFKENQVPGHLLVDKDNEFIKAYKIRSFPQCFLLDEEHKLVFENTSSPLDGFEQQFGNWLRNQLFMRQRNQSKQ